MARNWLRDLVLVPLIVGIIVAIFTFLLPTFWKLSRGKEISYTIDGPTQYLSAEAGSSVKIIVDNVVATSVFAYRVHLWNSGDSAVKDLPILFSFGTQDDAFKILLLSHHTVPEQEFGKIVQSILDPKSLAVSKRLIYELLNPKDEDTVTFWTTASVPLSVYAKVEGLEVKHASLTKKSWFKTFIDAQGGVLALLSGILAVISSLVAVGVREAVLHKSRKPFQPSR